MIKLRIAEILQEKGISKNRLCLDLNLQRGNLNKYCNDKFLRIDAALLIKLCDYFQCDISDLLEIRELHDSKEETTQSPVTFRPIYRKYDD